MESICEYCGSFFNYQTQQKCQNCYCNYLDCYNEKKSGFNFCSNKHRCEDKKCVNAQHFVYMPKYKSNRIFSFCKDHFCQYYGPIYWLIHNNDDKYNDDYCYKKSLNGSKYCFEHKCPDTKCLKSKYCLKHVCEYGKNKHNPCKNLKKDESQYCSDHICPMKGCLKSMWCKKHVCNVKYKDPSDWKKRVIMCKELKEICSKHTDNKDNNCKQPYIMMNNDSISEGKSKSSEGKCQVM